MNPNIVWVTLESVRFDHTSFGSSDETLTPNLADIATASDGRVFENCFAHARWTPASTASILTGTYLSSHRVGYADTTNVNKLPDELASAPELLGEVGYRTACFSENGYISPATGFDRGFDTFQYGTSTEDLLSAAGVGTVGHYLTNGREHSSKFSPNPDHHKGVVKALHQIRTGRQWIEQHANSEAPFFAYFHLNNPHHPYRPPLAVLDQVLADDDLQPKTAIEIAAAVTDNMWEVMADGCELESNQRRALAATYEAEVRYADYLVGLLFEYVRTRDDTILVITGDHGELFGESGVLGHNLVLHDKILNVPLVTYGLDLSNVEQDALVQHMDVMETLLDTAGANTEQFQGVDLTGQHREFVLAERGPRPSDIEKLNELNPEFDPSRFSSDHIRCIRCNDWKYLSDPERAQLFVLPDESQNRIDEYPERTNELETQLENRLPSTEFGVVGTERAEFDEEMRDHLRDMGYLE